MIYDLPVMVGSNRIICVLPALNAELTLERTVSNVQPGIVDLFIVVDDDSMDRTCAVAESLAQNSPVKLVRHTRTRGYGANQKTCYREALANGADIVVMLHPDYQYEPRLLGALVLLVASGVYDIALGSRILGNGAIAGGMPAYKYVANRVLTAIQNVAIGQKLSEYHTGYRAYSRRLLERLNIESYNDGFLFDNEILVRAHLAGFRFGEISVPTRYSKDSSSINFKNSVVYGIGVLQLCWLGWLARWQRPRR